MKALLLALALSTVARGKMFGDVEVTVTPLTGGRYQYTYSAPWHSRESLEAVGIFPVMKSGVLMFTRDDGGRVATQFNNLRDAKQPSLWGTKLSTKIDGKLEVSFVSKGAPVMGRFWRGFRFQSGGYLHATVESVVCPVPSSKHPRKFR